MIEVVHNPDVLPFRVRAYVTNATQAYDKVLRMCEAKRNRGYRLRMAFDVKGGWIELSGRSSEPVRIAVRLLKDCNMFKRGTNAKTIH